MKKSAKGNAGESNLSSNIDDYVGAVEAADLIGINYRTFIRLDERQGFAKKQFGRRLYYLRDDLLRFIKTQGEGKTKEFRILGASKMPFEEFEVRFKKEAKHCKPLLKEEVYRFFKDFKKRSADDKNSLMNMLQTVLSNRKTSGTYIAVSVADLKTLWYWYRYVMTEVFKEEYRFLLDSVYSVPDLNGEYRRHKITIINKENLEVVLGFEMANVDYSPILVDFLRFLSSDEDQGIMKSCYQRGQGKVRNLNLTYSEFIEIARIMSNDEKVKKLIDMMWMVFRDGKMAEKFRE